MSAVLAFLVKNKGILGYVLGGIVLVALVGSLALQTSRLDAAQTKNQVQQSQLEEQSKTINKMTELKNFVDEQYKERQSFQKALEEQSTAIGRQLNELKAQNQEYAECANTSLPYSIDSMFGSPNNKDDNG